MYKQCLAYIKAIKILKKPMRFWLPNTDVAREIYYKYKSLIRDNDFIVVSDKALSVAYGYIYNEGVLKSGLTYEIATWIISRFIWGRIFTKPFSKSILYILRCIDIATLAKHKRLSLRIGGLKHFIKPISEAGIDTTNLPYEYASIPIPKGELVRIIDELYLEIRRLFNKRVNLLVLDSDKCYKPKLLEEVAFSTRYSIVRGIIDLGGIAYFIGKYFDKYFNEYPTPVAYKGVRLPLRMLLLISKICERSRGFGLGRNIVEVCNRLGRINLSSVRWIDLLKIKHYPVIICRVKWFK